MMIGLEMITRASAWWRRTIFRRLPPG